MDYIFVGSILSQVIMVAYYTISPFAVLTMLVASVMNSMLAVAAALWFARMFTKNLFRGSRSKSHSALRLVFILLWGSLLMGVSQLISLPYYIVPSLEMILRGSNQIINILFSFLHPFSSGLTIANITEPVTTSSRSLMALFSMVGYVIVAGFAGNWMLKTVKRISLGTDVKMWRETVKDCSVKTHKPVIGYILKDLKTSSRNPAIAFFFALPVLVTVIISFILANSEYLPASILLVSTFMGGILVLLMPLALLSSEGTGLEYTKTLPLNINKIITSKALISTLIYVPVPLVLFVMSFLKPLSSPFTILIPFFVIMAIASASIFEIQLFLSSVNKGKIAALIHDFMKLIVGVTTLIIPLATYVMGYLISFSHIFAVLGMGGATVSELAIAVYLLRCNEK